MIAQVVAQRVDKQSSLKDRCQGLKRYGARLVTKAGGDTGEPRYLEKNDVSQLVAR